MINSEIKKATLTLKLIADSVKKHKEFERIKGENFNLFNILDRRTNEVKTHSPFIAELLNPKGSHFLDKCFLELFIKMLNKKKETSSTWEPAVMPKVEDFENVNIECEKSIGKISNNTGGRLDILISNTRFQICIENKILADEQCSQLERYRSFIDKFPKPKNLLIYLTLYGENSKESKLVSGSDYYVLSYKYDILEWLEDCFKETADIPILRESIKQYIILIRSLTNQVTSNEMKKEIHNLIYTNIISSEKIAQEFDNAIDSVANELRYLIKGRLIEENIISDKELISIGQDKGKFSSIWIKVKSDDKLRIGIESFNGKGHKDGALFIGVVDFKKSDNNIKYKFGIWLDNRFEIIWDKSKLYMKLQEFANGTELTKVNIANEIVKKVAEYIEKNF